MCWALSITISLKKDTDTKRARLQAFLDDHELCFEGSFPHYSVTNGHCGCSLVRAKGERLGDEAIEMLSSLLELADVATVSVYWYAQNKRKLRAAEISLNLIDFIARNSEAASLRRDVYWLHCGVRV